MKHILGADTSSKIYGISSQSVQPNAVDLTLNRVFSIYGTFRLDEDNKSNRKKEEIHIDTDGYFNLRKDYSYEITFNEIVSIGENEAGILVPRSTLNRNGIFITSGLYDSGYGAKESGGVLGACLHVRAGDAYIKKDTRIAQFILFDAEMLHTYNGDYGKLGELDSHLR